MSHMGIWKSYPPKFIRILKEQKHLERSSGFADIQTAKGEGKYLKRVNEQVKMIIFKFVQNQNEG